MVNKSKYEPSYYDKLVYVLGYNNILDYQPVYHDHLVNFCVNESVYNY